jgi:hypothetical protein
MPCNASYARFIFGKFFTSTIILYVLLFAQKFYFCKKWVLQNFNQLADETFAEAWERYHGIMTDLPTASMEDWEFT